MPEIARELEQKAIVSNPAARAGSRGTVPDSRHIPPCRKALLSEGIRNCAAPLALHVELFYLEWLVSRIDSLRRRLELTSRARSGGALAPNLRLEVAKRMARS